jgi:carbamoyltransferase
MKDAYLKKNKKTGIPVNHMNIFSVAVNMHDHNTYNGKLHYLAERYTRKKHNLNPTTPHDPEPSREFFREHFLPNYNNKDHMFAFTCSNLGQEFVRDQLEDTLPDLSFLDFTPTNLWDYYKTDDYYYIDHHQSHAAYAFLSSGFKQSDVLAIDGRGWQFNCIFTDKDGNITDLTDKVSIGGLWNRLSQKFGFSYLGAGKTMGLAGFGKYNRVMHYIIDMCIASPNQKLSDDAYEILKRVPKENAAFTLQVYTENLIKKHVYPLKSCDNLCLTGGVAYNGYVNEEFTKHYTNVHVPPAVGDEGQSLGTYMHAEYTQNNNVHVPDVYAGKEYNYVGEKALDIKEVAQSIADGKIVGWFQGKSESGNRALGNRSILADPRNANIKDIINSTVKMREDFRPFAPAVLEEHYKQYFDTTSPSPYMSRICKVNPEMKNVIPGVIHVDGTARIQTVNKKDNSKFYELIREFGEITGVPMLVNTSFNCQEPIVETPEHALRTFKKTAIDILVIGDYVICK